MNFEFATATRILFGEGRIAEVGSIASTLGRRALLVQGGGDRAAPLRDLLREAALGSTDLAVGGEPTVELVERGVELAREERCDLIVAVGGGSVLDAGKAIAALLTNPGTVRDYLEVVGEGRPLRVRSAPLIAIPTTAGTGAEVTRNAVLGVPEERVKVSLRSPLMLPHVALVDPTLTRSLPADVTASTGLDALTQCIEPFVTPAANPLSDAVAREGMRRAASALRRAVRDGNDADARSDMAIASLCGGLALANARLGAVHGFAAPLGGMYPVPHGVACALLLGPAMEANIAALRAREPASPALARHEEAARLLTGRPDALPEEGASWVAELVAELHLPPLSAFGFHEADLDTLVARARRAGSMQGNPIELSDEELAGIVRAATRKAPARPQHGEA